MVGALWQQMWYHESSQSLERWESERQKNKDLGVYVLSYKSLSFDSTFTPSIQHMEDKIIARVIF